MSSESNSRFYTRFINRFRRRSEAAINKTAPTPEENNQKKCGLDVNGYIHLLPYPYFFPHTASMENDRKQFQRAMSKIRQLPGMSKLRGIINDSYPKTHPLHKIDFDTSQVLVESPKQSEYKEKSTIWLDTEGYALGIEGLYPDLSEEDIEAIIPMIAVQLSKQLPEHKIKGIKFMSGKKISFDDL